MLDTSRFSFGSGFVVVQSQTVLTMSLLPFWGLNLVVSLLSMQG